MLVTDNVRYNHYRLWLISQQISCAVSYIVFLIGTKKVDTAKYKHNFEFAAISSFRAIGPLYVCCFCKELYLKATPLELSSKGKQDASKSYKGAHKGLSEDYLLEYIATYFTASVYIFSI